MRKIQEKVLDGGNEPKALTENIKTRISRGIFEIYYELLRNRNISYSMGSIYVTISFLQLFGYIYYRKANFPFEEDQAYEFGCQVLEMLRIYPEIEKAKNGGNYLAISISVTILVAIYWIGLIYIHYSISINKFYFRLPVQIMRTFSLAFYWVLLSPITEILLSILSCEDGKHIVATELECWTGIHLFYVFLFTFALAGFLLILLLISYFFNESRNSSTDIMARLDTNFELYFGLYRVMAAILGEFLLTYINQWILVFFYLLSSLNFLKLYNKYLPYYHSSISILLGAGLLSYFWVTLNLFLSKALENMRYNGETLIIVVGILLSYPLIKHTREDRIYNLIFGHKHNKIRNDYELDIYIGKLVKLIGNQRHSHKADCLVTGFVNLHREECSAIDCPLVHTQPLYLPLTNTLSGRVKSNLRDNIVTTELINHIQSEYAANSEASCVIHILYSNFLFYKMGNVHMALMQLNTAEKCEKSLQQKFSIYRSKMMIEDYLFLKYKKGTENKLTLENLDITIVIIFEFLFSKLQKAIERSASEHIEFWTHLDSVVPDLNEIHKLGLNIISYTKECTDLWGKLNKINKRYPKALHLYGYYLSEIKNDQEEGDTLIEEARGLALNKSLEDNLSDYELLFAPNSAIVVVSGSKENLLNITKTSSGVQQVFGYNSEELIGYDVNKLLPYIIAHKHRSFVEHYFRTGQERMLNRDIPIFAIKRTGLLFSISMSIKCVPSIMSSIQYIALIRPFKTDYDLILTDHKGRIDSISEGFMGHLGLPSVSFFRENEVYIQLICPDLLNISLSKTGIYVTLLDWLLGFTELHFQVPKNFSFLVQNMSKNLDATIPIQDDITEDMTFSQEEDDDQPPFTPTSPETPDSPESPTRVYRPISRLSARMSKFLLPNAIKLEKKPEIVNRIESMLRGVIQKQKRGGKQGPLNVLKAHINYEDCEYNHTLKTEILDIVFGNGELKLKLFKIQKEKSYEVSESSSGYMKYTFKATASRPQANGRVRNLGIESGNILSRNPTSSFAKEVWERNSGRIEREDDQNHDIQPNYTAKNSTNLDLTLNKSLDQSNINLLEGIGKFEMPVGHMGHMGNMGKMEKNEEYSESKGEDNIEECIVERSQEVDSSDDIGSTASTTKTFSKFLRSLRSSMYEKYNPPAVKRLNISARLVFLVLIVITTISYFMTDTLYKEMENGAELIRKAKYRLTSSIALGYSVRALYLMNDQAEEHFGYKIIDPALRTHIDYLEVGKLSNSEKNRRILEEVEDEDSGYLAWIYHFIEKHRGKLNEAQTVLSTENKIGLKDKAISPEAITVYYNEVSGIPQEFEMDSWSAFISLVIHAYKIREIPIPEVTLGQQSVAYVLRNAYNSLLGSVQDTQKLILDNSKSSANYVEQILLLLLGVATSAIFLSLAVVAPVVRKVFRIKEAMLALFLEIPRYNVKTEFHKSRKFYNTIRGDTQIDGVGKEEEEGEDEEEEGLLDIPHDDGDRTQLLEKEESSENNYRMPGHTHKSKQRKFKPYSTKFHYLICKFMFFFVILEGYFVISYFSSNDFLDEIIMLLKEIKLTTQREYTNSLLLRFQLELIGTNGTANVFGGNILSEMDKLLDTVIDQQTKLLELHSENSKHYHIEFNDFFNELMFKNGCNPMYYGPKLSKCKEFMSGILLKGLHSSTIAYWDIFREITNDFLNVPPAARTFAFQTAFLNNERFLEAEIMEASYLQRAYDKLGQKVSDNILLYFEQEEDQIYLYFILFLLLLVVIYLFIWRYFLESTRKALWTTKSMLAIIPPQIIVDVQSIREFLISSTRSMIFGMSNT